MHVCMHFWTEYLAIVILKVTHHICSFKGNLHIYMVEKGIFKKYIYLNNFLFLDVPKDWVLQTM